jgi:PAS domain S-box-containing protein
MNRFETRMFSLTRRQQYGIAILAVGLMAVIRSVLDPLLGAELPYFFFIFPVVLACWLGGLWPGLLATGLSLVVADYLFVAPRGSVFFYDSPSGLLHVISFGIVGIAFSLVFDWSRRAVKAEWLEREIAQERVQFFSDLSEALLPISDANQIMAVAVRMLGEHLRADRCVYAEAETGTDHFVILGKYVRHGASRIEWEDAMCQFGGGGHGTLQDNRPYVVNDIETESATGEDLSRFRQAEIRSLVCVPLKKDGSFVARLAVLQKRPRYWSNEEIKLISIVANRCWETATRARTVRRLKDADERYRAFISNSSEAIWRYELDEPIPVTLPEDEQIELFYQRGYLAECNEAFARVHGRSSVNELRGERLTVLLVRTDAERIIEHSRAFVRSGYHLMGAETREVDVHGNTKFFLSNLVGIVENGVLLRAWGTQRDITDQTEAVSALRASEERLGRITDATQDALWEINLKTNELWWSEGARPLFGLNPGELQISLEDWYRRIHPEDADRVRTRFEEFVNAGGGDWVDEYRFRRADGFYVYIHDRGRKFLDDRGTPLRIAGAMVDVTERKHATEERESLLGKIESERDRLTQILEQMPVGVSIAEAPSGRVIFHNLQAARLLRHPLIEAENYTAYKQYGALHEDGSPYRPEEYPGARSLLSREIISGEEMRYRRGDGTETFFSVDSAPIYDSDGHMVLTVVTFIDIAERKHAQEALRQSEERFSKAFRASPDSLVITRVADGLIIEVNDSFVSLAGYSRDELLGKRTLSMGLYADPKDRERMVAILKRQNYVRDFEFLMKRKSGEIRLMRFSAEPLELRGEQCWLTIGHDVTERKQAEQAREGLLRHEKAAREEAEAANRIKDEFLATVSHELRTPLTAIMGWAAMLLKPSLPAAQARHAVEVIARSAKSQSELIADILDVSRIVTGKFKLDVRPVEIESVFHAAVDVVQPSAEAKRIALHVVIDGRHRRVLADASRLQQAIWNLLSNAVKFTSEGGQVEAQLSVASGRAEISISDTGIGIDPQFLPHLFEQFRQADSSSTRRYGGLGLGLAIVRHVVEMHGGTVSASSPGPGQGSTFRITLPLIITVEVPRPAAATEPKAEPAASGTAAQKRQMLDHVRVLVVEDDSDTLDLLKLVLHDNGADVVTAPSAREAVNVLEHWRPDVLVSDLAMPEEDGYQLIKQVRSRGSEQGGNTPAVALTAYTRDEDRTRALAAGFQMHLGKPIEPKELIAALATLSGRAA